MTLGMAWERVVGGVRELIVVSDSRLSGGRAWDCNPKILLLPRTDAVISFAGSTSDAYPLMLQAYNAIRMFEPASKRTMDITDLKGHLLRIFNDTQKFIHSFPNGQYQPDNPEATFLLSGYSWKEKCFKIWKLHFDDNIKAFTFRPTSQWGGQSDGAEKMIAFVGDNDCVEEAKVRLVNKLKGAGKIQSGSLDMEPFEVLRDMLRSDTFHSIGGSPQMVKIYEHANTAPVSVYWPTKSAGKLCFLGRPLMDYEKNSWGAIDPDDPVRAFPVV